MTLHSILLHTAFEHLFVSVKAILEHPLGFSWQLQGFGMLRLYLSSEKRLHIWDERFAVPGVSTIHDHPWDFDSVIIAGRMRQHRFVPMATGFGDQYFFDTIACGPGGGALGNVERCWLRRAPTEVFKRGQVYSQEATEIHESFPENGTVTLIQRKFKEDTEHARVFWKEGPWVSAEPRTATQSEVEAITAKALEWFQ